MYDTKLARNILETLSAAFPQKLHLHDLKAALPAFENVPDRDWLLTIQALRLDRKLDGVFLPERTSIAAAAALYITDRGRLQLREMDAVPALHSPSGASLKAAPERAISRLGASSLRQADTGTAESAGADPPSVVKEAVPDVQPSDQSNDLHVASPDSVPAAQIQLSQPTKTVKTEKGNIAILHGIDGELKRVVTLDVARRFGGVSLRAIQDAAKNGKLATEGERLHRRVLVASLLRYFPPEK
jgi:hypothetical protein